MTKSSVFKAIRYNLFPTLLLYLSASLIELSFVEPITNFLSKSEKGGMIRSYILGAELMIFLAVLANDWTDSHEKH